MRTTVNLDDDVLAAARQRAATDGVSLGESLSRLVREGMTARRPSTRRNGIELLPAGGAAATIDDVNALRDDPA